MSSLKFIFLLLALVTVIGAQEMDSMEEDMEDDFEEDVDLEAVEDLPSTEASTKEPIEESSEPKYDDIDSKKDNFVSTDSSRTTKSTTEVIESKDQKTDPPTQQMSESTVGSTESITILFEEMEERLMDSNSGESTPQPSIINSSTDSQDITSEFNGLDVTKNEYSFSCYGKAFGQYADVAKECHVFHLCYPYFNSTTEELLYQRISFLCDNDSVFDQKRFICVENSTVEHKCSDSEDLYLQTNQEYLIRVFSQSVSPNDEVKGQSVQGSDRNWMNWLNG